MIAAIGEYHRAAGSQRNSAAAKLKTVAQQRRAVILSTIERHPGQTLRQAMPNGLTTVLPADVRALIEQEVELTGFVGMTIAEDMTKGVASRKYFLNVATGSRPGRYRLHVADLPGHAADHEHPVEQYVGQTVTLTAYQIDGELLLAGQQAIQTAGSTETTTVTTTAAISGTQSTLVLLGNLKDKALDSFCTPSYVNSLMFGPSNSVDDLYRQTSNGAVRFSGPTYGPFQMSISTTSTDFQLIAEEMEKIAAAQGININSYAKTLFVIPRTASGYLGYASIGERSPGVTYYRAFVTVCDSPDTYAHELGHLIGFSHSSTPTYEYGDYSDIMGGGLRGLRHFSAARRVGAGWIPSSRTLNINGAGTFTIAPNAEANPANPQALVLPKPDTKDSYFISLRQPIGYDANLLSDYVNRVSIHRQTSPASNSTLLATLDAGGVLSDSVNGYRFTVNSIGTSSASVTIDMPTASCARANPAVSISPVSQSGSPGKAVSYQVTVTNKNSSACGTSTFGFAPQLPSGWSSSNSPFTVSLGSGASASSSWTVTAPTNVAEQSYAVYLTTYDTAATNSGATVQGSYIVTMPDSGLPMVTITSPTNGSTVSGNVTVAASATDNLGVSKVEFRVDGVLVATDTSAPYSFGWNTRKLSGSHTITATAYDTAGNQASASSTVTVTPSSGGGPKKR
jgi:hypothetical protein